MSLEELLVKWGFQHLIAPFKEQDIDLECLMLADDSFFQKYIPTEGRRMKFKHYVLQQKCQQLQEGKSIYLTASGDECLLSSTAQSVYQDSQSTDPGGSTCVSEESTASLVELSSMPGPSSVSGSLSFPGYSSLSGASSLPGTSGALSLPGTSGAFSLPGTSGVSSLPGTSGASSLPGTSCATAVTSKRQRVSYTAYANSVVDSFSLEHAIASFDVKAKLMGDPLLNHLILNSKPLDATARRKVVATVCNALLLISKRLSLEHLKAVSEKIIEVFPTETLETYFLQPHPPQQPAAKGKIVDRYNNTRGPLLSLTKVTETEKSQEPTVIVETPSAVSHAVKDAIAWLKYNRSPWCEVVEKWDCTHEVRMREVFKSQPVFTYFDNYPVLRHKSGVELLVNDFNRLHSSKSGCLFSVWPNLREGILELSRKNVKDAYGKSLISEYSSDLLCSASKDLLALCLLPSLCQASERVLVPSADSKNPSKKTYWKPSIAESRAGFMLHVKTASDVQTCLSRRRETLRSAGLTCQPTTVVVGPTLVEAKHYHISIDSELYTVAGPLQAVDMLFKSFQAMNSEYPREARHLWLLLQRMVYKITTPDDKVPTAVTALISSLQPYL